ncbi:hypothetical protein [Clostridium tyrobutyricum]|uniref:hypothetical protein n=1 Tax=Clostridium tyrobutyricum TaxID=1519 RepID=UPI001C38746A|nr:hypothetical protein [Clostridium tyrobutyricum]MBV4428312.1 hypothetical protein [Clostridium tyrobutyricum]MBV4443302.1 hypothetical protein [Clostridium tyrobutyricum]
MNKKKILIITDILIDTNELEKRLKDIYLWDKVICMKEKNKAFVKEIDNIKIGNDDILHIFSFGGGMSTYLIFKYVLNKKVRIILTEEGTSTYFSEYIIKKIAKKSNFNLTSKNIIDRIDEVWLLNKDFYMEKNCKIIKNIDMSKLQKNISLEWLRDLNYIFKYQKENIYEKLIFFDGNFGQAGSISVINEKLFLNGLFSILDNFKVKLPPNDLLYKYSYFRKYIIKNVNVPWEVIYLNNMFFNSHDDLKIYMTHCSTAVFNMKFIDPSRKMKIIFLYKLLYSIQGYENYFSDVNMLETIIDKYSSIYPEDEIYIPKSFKELKMVLNVLDVYKNDSKEECEDYLFNDSFSNKYIEMVSQKLSLNKNMKEQLYYLDLDKNRIKRFVIWGASISGSVTFKAIRSIFPYWKFIGFLDKYKKGEFMGSRIYKPEDYDNLNPNMTFIATNPGKLEVEKLLIEKGLELGKDYLYGYKVQ